MLILYQHFFAKYVVSGSTKQNHIASLLSPSSQEGTRIAACPAQHQFLHKIAAVPGKCLLTEMPLPLALHFPKAYLYQ